MAFVGQGFLAQSNKKLIIRKNTVFRSFKKNEKKEKKHLLKI